MSDASQNEFPIPLRRAFVRHRKSHEALTAELQAALAREAVACRRRTSWRSVRSCWRRNSSIGLSTVCN